jgi:hypothetical protein
MDAEEEPKFYELAPWQRMQYKVETLLISWEGEVAMSFVDEGAKR